MNFIDLTAAALPWGRRFVFAAAGLLVACGAQAEDPTPESLVADGILTLPESCVETRRSAGIGDAEHIGLSPVGDDAWVALVLCDRFAYQTGKVAMRIERQAEGLTAILLAFPVWRETEATPWPYIAYQPRLIGLTGEVQDGLFTLDSKSRGSGDCGETITYDVSSPVVRIDAYRAKFECDGTYVDPDQWESVPQEVLDDYTLALDDSRVAALLDAVMTRWPQSEWMGHAIARLDLDGDGTEEQWIGGYGWGEDGRVYRLVREEDGALKSWDLPVSSDEQTAVCQPAAALVLEDDGTLAIDDGVCDRLRVGWDASAEEITLDRQ